MEQIKYGKICNTKDAHFHRFYAGGGSTDEGQEFDLGVAAVEQTPIVFFKDKMFCLSWNDIILLAADAGLFNE